MDLVLKASLRYAELGFRIVPNAQSIDGVCSCYRKKDCHTPGKHPTIKEWTKNATNDYSTLKEWHKKGLLKNVGLLTGKAGGFVVIDVDDNGIDKFGKETLESLENELGKLPPTIEAITGSRGMHLLFKAPEQELKNVQDGALGDWIDIRGEGGQIIVYPSIHPNGNRYEWELGNTLGEDEMAELPKSWLDKILDKKSMKSKVAKKVPEVIKNGNRDNTFFSLACSMWSKGFDEDEIYAALSETNKRCETPLDGKEILEKIESATKYKQGTSSVAVKVDTVVSDLNIESLSEHELLQDANLKYLFKNAKGEKTDLYFRYRGQAKKLKIVKEFDKYYKKTIEKQAVSRINKQGYCQFNDERFNNICTGEWKATTDGIYKQIPNGETGEVDLVEASRMMIVPTEIYLNVDTREEKVKVMFNKYNKWNELICAKDTLSINHKIVELSKRGIDVTSSNCKHIVDYFYECFTLNDETGIPFYNSLSRMGWYYDKFMPYSLGLKFDGEQQNKSLYDALAQKGDRNKWIKYVSNLRKSKLLRMQMAVSFASPLIEKLSLLPFILHLWGKSGSGKTVGMIVSMSIWGNPVMGQLTKSMNNTVNSVMDTCAFMKNIPVALDELQAIKDKMGYDKFVMLLCEGVERGRMKFDENKATRSWKNAFLFTGEEPVTNDYSGGGVFNRVIEVDVTGKEVIDAEIGEEIVGFVANNYGLIAEEYISSIINDLEEIRKMYKKINSDIKIEVDTTNKQSMAMSMLLLGDALAIKYFFKDEKALNIEDIKEYLFSEEEVDVTERAYQYVLDIISTNVKRFEYAGNSGEVWGKFTSDKIYFQKQKLSELMKDARFELRTMVKTWADKKHIAKNSQGKYSHKTTCFGIKSNYIIFNKNFEDIE